MQRLTAPLIILVALTTLVGCSDPSEADSSDATSTPAYAKSSPDTPASTDAAKPSSESAAAVKSPEIQALTTERREANRALFEHRQAVAELERQRAAKAAELSKASASNQSDKVNSINAELAAMDGTLADKKALGATMFRAFKALIERQEAAVKAAG